MLSITNKHIVYDFNMCQQCGACIATCPQKAISMINRCDGLREIAIDNDKCICCKKCVNVCPAHRKNTKNDYLNSLINKRYYFAWNDNNKYRHDSSSGGATKTIIIESLKSGVVDGVYSLKKIQHYPSAIGEFYTRENIPSYDDIPNSVYHSIMACTEIKKVQKVHRLMIVGTSCQLYALERALKGKYDELVKVCIFCKQQKTLDSTKWLAKVSGTSTNNKNNLKTIYRGIGWPGFVRINNKSIAYEHAASLPFGRRLWMVPGCNICGDPFGIEVEADISVMDPWVIRKKNDLGETLVVIHTDIGNTLITETAHLGWEEKSYDYVEPALGIQDVWRKRECVPYFKGEQVSPTIEKAGKAEVTQRRQLEWILEKLPRLPFICYRLLNKIVPKKRDQILKR